VVAETLSDHPDSGYAPLLGTDTSYLPIPTGTKATKRKRLTRLQFLPNTELNSGKGAANDW